MALFRCAVSGVFASGETWSFRWHMDSAASLATVQVDWDAQITSAWTNGSHGIEVLYPTGTVANQTSVAQLDPLTYRETTKSFASVTLPGTDATGSLPEQTVILVSLRAGDVGRKNRGRTRLPAPAEDKATGGLLGATDATRVSTAMDDVRTGMLAAGHSLYIYNVKASAHDLVAFTRKPIVRLETDRVLRTLRQRTRSRAALYQ
jgi:hypothetical protein